MKFEKIYSTILGSILLGTTLLITQGCTANFEQINRPGGLISEAEMSRDNFKLGAFFPQMMDNAFPAQENSYQMNENLIGGQYGRYMMYTKDAWNSTSFLVYNAPEGWIKHPFNDVMGKFYTAWNKVKTDTNGEGVNFAWAQILRVTAMQRLTDMYGPIPYSKVASGDLKVPYDSQEDAYKNMFTDLTNAIKVLDDYIAIDPTARPMAQFDKMYQGDFAKWVKYANSLKLRMAIRISKVDAALAQSMAEEAVNHPIGVMTANSDNAVYQYQKNPLWVMWDSYGDARVSADITSYMNGYNDPRRSAFFQETTIDTYQTYVGVRSAMKVESEAWTKEYSAPRAEKLDPVLWMPVAEVTFNRAEGALMNWNMGGNVEELYNLAINQSFEQWNVKGADNYIYDMYSRPGSYDDPKGSGSINAVSDITIQWNDFDSMERKMERLITQKWLAMWPLGQEAWSDIRRTGYPKIFPLASKTALTIQTANRIPFSSDEYLNNKENMPEALNLLNGPDNYETKMWWQSAN